MRVSDRLRGAKATALFAPPGAAAAAPAFFTSADQRSVETVRRKERGSPQEAEPMAAER